MSSEPYPDRDGERRRDDSALIVRLASDVSHWWRHRLGRLAQFATIIAVVVTIGGGIAGGLVTVGTVRANFAGLPDRVSRLESYRDTVLRPRRKTLRRHDTRLDTLSARLQSVRSNVQSLRSMLQELRDLAQANNCWIRVAAGQQSRFDCSATPGEGDG